MPTKMSKVRSAPMFTAPTIWQRPAPFAIPLAVIALALSVWVVVRASANDANTVVLPGDPKVRVCNAFEMVATMQARNALPAPDAIRSFTRDLQDVGMNALAGVPYSDPRQAARQAEGDFDRRQVADLCT